MNLFHEYIPATVDMGEPRRTVDFTTLEELLASTIVSRWQGIKGFSHFCVSDECPTRLMAIFDDGFGWHVVGFLKDPVDLPKWEGWKFRAILCDGSVVILSDEVVASCGSVLTLRDGSNALQYYPKEDQQPLRVHPSLSTE